MGVYHSLVDTCTYIPTVEVIQDKEDSVKFVGVYHSLVDTCSTNS